MALKPPVEVPQGAIRLNTDSNKLEFFAQDQWWEMSTEITIPGAGRGLNGGGITPSATNVIDMFSLETGGDATDFGDLIVALTAGSSSGSRTRGIFWGGYAASPNPLINNIDYVTIASQGNALDFGEGNTESIWSSQGIGGNQIRGFKCGGTTNPASVNQIVYITIAQTGNSIDFADITGGTYVSCGVMSGTTRMVLCGGGPATAPSTTVYNSMEYITMSTLGNGVDFGDLTFAGRHFAGASNGTRGVIGGGWAHPTAYSTLQVSQIATLGNAINFGDLSVNMAGQSACSSPIKSVWIGGSSQVMEAVSFPSLGNAIDFGNLTQSSMAQNQATSNAHGGL